MPRRKGEKPLKREKKMCADKAKAREDIRARLAARKAGLASGEFAGASGIMHSSFLPLLFPHSSLLSLSSQPRQKSPL